MKTMKTVAAAALTIALLSPATAIAKPTEATKLHDARPIATTAWAGSRCHGRVKIHTASIARRALHRFESRIAAGGGWAQLDGYSRRATCEVWIKPGLSTVRFCDVLVHEEGHIAGMAHLGAKGRHPVDPWLARSMFFMVGEYPPCHGTAYTPTAGTTRVDTAPAPLT